MKIFLVALCLLLVVFSVIFIVALPLIYEQRLISSRLSSWYVQNFYYSQSVYFFLGAVFSVLIYRFVKSMRVEAKIFIITFATMWWAFLGAMATTSSYWGNPGHPLWVVTMVGWGDPRASYIALLIFYVVSFYLLIISTIVVIIYKISGFALRVPEGKIFILSFITSYIALFAAIFVLLPVYWGLDPRLTLPFEGMYGFQLIFLCILGLALYSSIPAAFSVLIYEIYILARKLMIERKHVDREKKTLN